MSQELLDHHSPATLLAKGEFATISELKRRIPLRAMLSKAAALRGHAKAEGSRFDVYALVILASITSTIPASILGMLISGAAGVAIAVAVPIVTFVVGIPFARRTRVARLALRNQLSSIPVEKLCLILQTAEVQNCFLTRNFIDDYIRSRQIIARGSPADILRAAALPGPLPSNTAEGGLLLASNSLGEEP